ncbi:MAG TPA: nuclear transport factor 2 family protein [Gaiellaceae bacterium]|nr:nuclear transport factor 2 family protein [Gaiellaceae bacterium]
MTTLDAARRWAREWERAWREHDVAAVAALYAPGASFRSSPFREPQDPGSYAEWAFADEEPGADVRLGEPVVVDGDRAAVEYWASVRDREGVETTIAGISLIRFGADGRVVEQRDYWHQLGESRRPHAGWGR